MKKLWLKLKGDIWIYCCSVALAQDTHAIAVAMSLTRCIKLLQTNLASTQGQFCFANFIANKLPLNMSPFALHVFTWLPYLVTKIEKSAQSHNPYVISLCIVYFIFEYLPPGCGEWIVYLWDDVARMTETWIVFCQIANIRAPTCLLGDMVVNQAHLTQSMLFWYAREEGTWCALLIGIVYLART